MRDGNPRSNFRRVRDFHIGYGVELPSRPLLPPADVLAIKKKLIDEEYAETTAEFTQLTAAQAAGEAPDITQIVHELTDLLYVTYGAILAFGVDADAVFAEVHRANMEKLGGPVRADGKQLKPPGWQPPDVAGVIARQHNADGRSDQ